MVEIKPPPWYRRINYVREVWLYFSSFGVVFALLSFGQEAGVVPREGLEVWKGYILFFNLFNDFFLIF